MRTQDAKKIPLGDILQALGYEPQQRNGRDVWYLSPFRGEDKPSFKWNTEFNSFYDFGKGAGGNVLDFAMLYYQTDLKGALVRLESLTGNTTQLSFLETPRKQKETHQNTPAISSVSEKPGGITLKKVQPLQNRALIQYLEQTRKIPLAVARPYVQEAYYTVTGRERTYFGLAFPNASDAYELRNAYFQGVAGRKDISVIGEASSEVLVFEGFMDFLSYLTHYNRTATNAIVLVMNSVALKDRAIQWIQDSEITRVKLYLDRDETGMALASAMRDALAGCEVEDHSMLYDGYKDFNALVQKQRVMVRG